MDKMRLVIHTEVTSFPRKQGSGIWAGRKNDTDFFLKNNCKRKCNSM